MISLTIGLLTQASKSGLNAPIAILYNKNPPNSFNDIIAFLI